MQGRNDISSLSASSLTDEMVDKSSKIAQGEWFSQKTFLMIHQRDLIKSAVLKHSLKAACCPTNSL